jgi:hypothetical protein
VGKQTSLFLLPDDYSELQTAIESCGPAAFLPDPLPGDGLTTIKSIALSSEEMGKVNLRVFVARTADLGKIKLRSIPNLAIHAVNEQESPVIEFVRCYYTGTLLRRGRVYVGTDANSDFREWARAVFKALSKLLTRDRIGGGVYMSRRVVDWKRSRRAEWKRDGFELIANVR